MYRKSAPKCLSARAMSILDASRVCCRCVFEQCMWRWMLSSCRYYRGLSPRLEHKGHSFIASVTTSLVSGFTGWDDGTVKISIIFCARHVSLKNTFHTQYTHHQ